MQSPVQLVKHAPRWAIYTAGGIAAGGIALRLYRNRTTSTSDTTTSDTSAASSPVSGSSYMPGGSPGVIVPPVIVSSGSVDQSGTGLGALQGLYLGGVQSLQDGWSTILGQVLGSWGQTQATQDTLLSTSVGELASIAHQTASTAGAGGPPQPVAQNPTPVNTPVPLPAPAPSPTPAPAAKPPDPCMGTAYPFKGPHGCYKVVCASGSGGVAKGRWHYYSNGVKTHVSSTC